MKFCILLFRGILQSVSGSACFHQGYSVVSHKLITTKNTYHPITLGDKPEMQRFAIIERIGVCVLQLQQP